MSLEWEGDAVLARAEAAAIWGVDKTMAGAVTHAQTVHPWQDQTGTLRAGTRIVESAHPDGDGVEGTWGVAAVAYAIFLELGTVNMPGGFPFLRPAADIFYPFMRAYIRQAFNARG